MVDRFGLLPEALKNLFRTTEIKLAAGAIGVDRVDIGAAGGRLEFGTDTTLDPLAVVQLVQRHPETYRFRSGREAQAKTGGRLLVSRQMDDPEQRFAFVVELLGRLAADPATTSEPMERKRRVG